MYADDPNLYEEMPVGVMLMARPGLEEKCLSIAAHIENALQDGERMRCKTFDLAADA